MKKYLWTAFTATVLFSLNPFTSVAFGADAQTELKALVVKVNDDIKAGKRTEAALADDLKQFDALLAEHRGEKTDAVARILFMKAMLYAEVLNNPTKADQLMKQLKSDYKGTSFVTNLEQREQMQKESEKNRAALVAGAAFPDFSEKDVNGQRLSLASYKGKVVLIDFWATWCGPCRGEIPNVVATYQKYHSRGFDIIGVSLDQDREKLLNYTKQMNITWPQFFDGQGWSNKLAVKYGIESIPATFLLDGQGRIIGVDLRGDALEAAVAKALAKK